MTNITDVQTAAHGVFVPAHWSDFDAPTPATSAFGLALLH